MTEVVVYQVNVLFFDPYRARKKGKPYLLQGYRRLVLLALHNYVELLCWFGVGYRNFPSLFKVPDGLELNSLACAFYYSLTTMSTLGYGDITPANHWALTLVVPQTLIGIFMTILILARFLALLPKPGTLDALENEEASDAANNRVREVLLQAGSGWTLLHGTADFDTVLSNAAALYIEMDVTHSSYVEASVDNVEFVADQASIDERELGSSTLSAVKAMYRE